MNERGLAWGFVVALAAAIVVAWWEWPETSLPPSAHASSPMPTNRAEIFALVGTPSCSARACHGGTGSAPNREIHQDEYTKWLMHDCHANAYQVLREHRSLQIAKNLQLKKPPHEETLCLACHTNPLTVGDTAEMTLLQRPDSREAIAIREERIFGVGCEACHGPASKWLQPHTEPGWIRALEAKLDADPMADDFGYKPMRKVQARAQTCAECHVGAPVSPVFDILVDDNLRVLLSPKSLRSPVRDVNHDLIAAGHPRMDFEFGSFMSNLSPHWNEDAWKKRRPANADIQEWLFGQLISAEAALELLADRAEPLKKGPWPEFAEYDCFACHHHLQNPSWRQKSDYSTRPPGSLPWGTWYLSMPRALAALPPTANSAVAAQFDKLAKTMAQPNAERSEIRIEALAATGLIKQWRTSKGAEQFDAKALRELLATVTEGRSKQFELSPQSAEQLYQAAIVLSLAQGDNGFFTANASLSNLRHCPAGFEGPITFNPTVFQTELAKFLKR